MRNAFYLLLISLVLHVSGRAVQPDPTPINMPPAERVYRAARLYNAVQLYFAHWTPELRVQFESTYQKYLTEILKSDRRRDFDLASIRLLASLHNGHTSFRDAWLDHAEGSPLGFNARDVDGKWIITASQTKEISVGDVIETIDGRPVDNFFEEARPYLADSSIRAQKTDFFSPSFLFPKQFTIGLSRGRSICVQRKASSDVDQESGVTGNWLQDRTIAYIKIPAFDGVTYQAKALELIHTFKDAHALILDLRGNPGGRGDPPRDLQMALMDKPYRSWIETSPAGIGRLGTMGYAEASLSSGPRWVHPEGRPEGGIFKGKLLLLVDRECASYCEDFVMPFKTAGRATLIGEVTAGTYAQTYSLDLGNGMSALIAATSEFFPNGTTFESIGIAPEYIVSLTADDLRSGRDAILIRGKELAAVPAKP